MQVDANANKQNNNNNNTSSSTELVVSQRAKSSPSLAPVCSPSYNYACSILHIGGNCPGQTRCLSSPTAKESARKLSIPLHCIISNTDLYARCQAVPVSREIQKRRMSMLGHVLRLDDDTPPRKLRQWRAIWRIPGQARGADHSPPSLQQSNRTWQGRILPWQIRKICRT